MVDNSVCVSSHNINTGTIICYKIFSGNHFVIPEPQPLSQCVNWSALYGQFTLEHTIAYLPNHFDRGHKYAVLVSIHSNRNLKCIIYKDSQYTDTAISSDKKADCLRAAVVKRIDGGHSIKAEQPILHTIGENLQSFVVMYDSDDLECAFPHNIINEDNFTFVTHAVFTRDDDVTWKVKNVDIISNDVQSTDNRSNSTIDHSGEQLDSICTPLVLSKHEKSDMTALAEKISLSKAFAKCSWIDTFR